MNKHDRLRRALLNERPDRTPVWFMRQAGRYMAEYREVRARVSFVDLCDDADLCAEVTCQPVDRFDTDAAIIFSDILTVPAAMGLELTFGAGHGPKLHPPVRDLQDICALRTPDVPVALRPAHDAIRTFRRLRPDVPILGFAGAPWTLLCYMVEGSGSKEWVHAKRLLWEAPDAADQLLNLLADVVAAHLQAQIDAGAAGVQLFDTLAGALSPEDYRRFALPAAQRVLRQVRGAPRVYFTKDTAPFLPWIAETEAECIGLDWRTDMRRAREALGPRAVQGNLDPILLHAPPDLIRARVHDVLRAAGPVGHVFNLGHGVVPSTPLEGVEAMIAAVRDFDHGSAA